MPDLSFFQVDAFSDRPFGGNPAGVIPLDAWLADDVLQGIAEENNLSETAFFVLKGDAEADFELRWFTPSVEVDLCGHATLASGHVLLNFRPDADKVRFKTRKSGVLTVARTGDGQLTLDLPAYAPTEGPGDLDPAALEAALGAPVEAVLTHPKGYVVCVLGDAAAVRALKPDFAALKRSGSFLTIVTAPGDGHHDVVSRVFAPAAGIDEDPVTGAAHAVLTPYWAARLGRDSFVAHQASRRGGELLCRLNGDRAELGGRCRTVVEGLFKL